MEIGKDITWDDLRDRYDAVVVAIGSRVPRDMKIPGRELDGIHFALDFLPDATRRIFGVKPVHDITAKDKHVIVIGGKSRQAVRTTARGRPSPAPTRRPPPWKRAASISTPPTP